MRAAPVLLGAALLAAAAPLHAQPPLQVWADLAVLGAAVDAPTSWVEGGFGRLTTGGDRRGLWNGTAIGEARLGAHWSAGERLAAHLHLRARAQAGDEGAAAGLVEAWAQAAFPLRDGADRLRLRGGQMFLPTSRENTGPLWSSPYTFTLSALDSWIGEEVRPMGVLAEYETGVEETQGFRLGGSLFWGNDTMGALLAWRGWAMGERLSVTNERLPLPALPSLGPGGLFEHQDPRGTTPLRELDGRPGWAAWGRWRRSDLALVQVTHLDNGGDRALHGDEYAWDTHYDQVSAELQPAVGWTLAAEAMRGRTYMGLPTPRADAAFDAAYLLASWERGPWRLSARYDHFSTADRDHQPRGEVSDESGHAWTAALRAHAGERFDIGLEWVDMTARRAALAGAGGGRREDGGRSLTLGARLRVGHAA